ncbi:MAG: immunity 49 family protein [Gemmataceae bacterium]
MGRAIRVGAQAHAGVLGAKVAPRDSYTLVAGELPSVPIASPEHRTLSIFDWSWALQLAILARHQAAAAEVYAYPRGDYAISGFVQEGPGQPFFELERQLWASPGFAPLPAIELCEDWCAHRISIAPREYAQQTQHLLLPYLAVVRALRDGERKGIEKAFVAALKSHKKYYGGTPKRSIDMAGFVSMELTTLAALMHDRGLPLDVQSDYMPRSWITGEVLKA